MDIDFIALLDPKQKFLEFAESKVKDFLKTREEYQKFEQLFVDIGKTVCTFEADGSELHQQMSFAFDAANMEKLAYIVHQSDALVWQKMVESHLSIYCQQAQISERDAQSCVAKAMEVFKHRLAKQYPQFLQLMKLDEMLHEIKVSGERSEDHFKTLEQTTGILMSDVKLVLERLLSKDESEKKAQNIPDFEAMMRGLPISEEKEWKLESRDSYGFFMNPQKRSAQRKELTQLWAEEREAYPGDYTLAYSKAEELRHKTQGYGMFVEENEIDTDDMLNFSYEYCWRWKHAMFIISAYDCKQLRRFFEGYEDHLRDEVTVDADKLFRWFYVGMCLLADAREELDGPKWNSIYRMLESHLGQTGAYQEECEELLWLEQVKMQFSGMQLSEVRRRIGQRQSSAKLYPVRLQIAGMLAECGDVIAAAEYLQALEQEIIQKLDSHVPGEAQQRFLLSLLSCAYQLHKFLLVAFRWLGKEGETCPGIPVDRKGLEDYFSFDRELECVQKDMLNWLYDTDRKNTTTFDVGRETVMIFGSGAPVCESGYYLYRLMEHGAFPAEVWNTYYLPKSVLYYMQSAIFQMCPMLGCQILLRGNNKEYIKRNFNHQFLASCSERDVHAMLDYVMQAFRFNMYEFKKHTGDMRQSQFTYLLENGVEILYRLASRCAPDQYTELLKLVAELMNENCITDFGGMDRLITYVFQYVPECKKAEYMNLFLKTTIQQRTPIGRGSQVDVFEVLNRNESTAHYFESAYVDEGYIDELLERRISNPAENIVRLERLIELYRFHKLNQNRIRRFTSLLWERRSEVHGLPDIPDRYMFSFLELPAPDDVDVLELIKLALKKWPWRDKLDGNGHAITMGNVRYFQELKGLCDYFARKEQICFTGEEVYDLIKDFEDYWQLNKGKIADSGDERAEIKNEFVKRFEKMQSVIAVLLKCCDGDRADEIRECVRSMYKDMYEHGIASVNVKLLVGGEDERISSIEEILDTLYVGEQTTSALNGAYDILTSHMLKPEAEEDFLIQILRIARTGKEKGLASLLAMIHNLFYANKVCFSEAEMKEVGKVLENILQRFQYAECLDEKQIKNVILIRHFAALLAGRVHRYCMDKNITEPSSVGEWKKVCNGNEFMDVKNAWME